MPSFPRHEFVRFLVNGLVATLIHFAVLTFLIEVVHVPLAAAASLVAALFGITASFLGNRYVVFRGHAGRLQDQVARFAGLYLAIACLHALALYLWADVLGLDYRVGFVIATGLQVMLSYAGNKLLVFGR